MQRSHVATKSSAYNNFHGKATLKSLDKASMTIRVAMDSMLNVVHTDLYLKTVTVTINFLTTVSYGAGSPGLSRTNSTEL